MTPFRIFIRWDQRDPKASGTPKAMHFTRGGPWFKIWQDVDYADLWLEEWAGVEAATG